jgi:hypothetical protein
MALSKEDERKKIALMRLGMSEQAALDVIDCDHEIDRGIAQEFDLDPETEKMAKKFANATTKKKPLVLENKPRPRKENPTKASIISELAKFLETDSENACVNVEITNKERQIAFAIGDQKYELTLVAKRPPKK